MMDPVVLRDCDQTGRGGFIHMDMVQPLPYTLKHVEDAFHESKSLKSIKGT